MRNKVLPGLVKHLKPITIKSATLQPGVKAEAISESEIAVSKDVPKNSDLYKRIIAHETHHCKEMASGKIDYSEDWIRDGDQMFDRKNGKIKQNGFWHAEGSEEFPWERRAIKAEKDV